MALRTKESLQKMLQASRERQEKKRQQLSIKKLKLKEERYQQNLINQRLDRASEKLRLQREKERKMEELQALVKKTFQKPLKQATEPPKKLRTYHTTTIERFSAEEDLYTTREELMAAEERGEGAIRWDVWDKLIAKGRKWNEEHFKH